MSVIFLIDSALTPLVIQSHLSVLRSFDESPHSRENITCQRLWEIYNDLYGVTNGNVGYVDN